MDVHTHNPTSAIFEYFHSSSDIKRCENIFDHVGHFSDHSPPYLITLTSLDWELI